MIHNTKYIIQNVGFTLIELLVVIAIMGTVGVMVSNLFFQTLKGSTKAELLKTVKQEGDYAISSMERIIRNAKTVESVCASGGSTASSITVTNQDDTSTSFGCDAGNTKITLDGADLTSSIVAVSGCGSFITCTQSGSTPPVVAIKFSLSQAGSSSRPEEQASVPFQTIVSLRNY